MRVLILFFVFLSRFVNASDPEIIIRSDKYSGTDIADAARLMHAEKGLSAWKVIGNNRLYQNFEREWHFSAYVYAEPQKVGKKLCMARLYEYSIFDFPDNARWDLFDRGNGYTVYFTAILQPGDTKSCAQLPLDRYFSTPDAIEDNTLVSLYNSLVRKLRIGRVEGVDPESFIVRGITLLPSYGGGYKYNASIETKGKMIYIPIKIESVEFHLKD